MCWRAVCDNAGHAPSNAAAEMAGEIYLLARWCSLRLAVAWHRTGGGSRAFAPVRSPVLFGVTSG